jgi:hypothetical protein
MTTTTKAKPDLFWNERGRIGCAIPAHAPYRGSDTWMWERWKRVTPRDASQFERQVGRPIACETCAAIARQESQP